MTPADKFAAVGVATACGAGADWADKLRDINVFLHTTTLVVGIIAGIASVVYYWTNRKSRHV